MEVTAPVAGRPLCSPRPTKRTAEAGAGVPRLDPSGEQPPGMAEPRGRLQGPLTRGNRRGAPRVCCTGDLPLPDAQRPEPLPTPLGCVPDTFPEKDIILVVSRQFSYEIVL